MVVTIVPSHPLQMVLLVLVMNTWAEKYGKACTIPILGINTENQSPVLSVWYFQDHYNHLKYINKITQDGRRNIMIYMQSHPHWDRNDSHITEQFFNWIFTPKKETCDPWSHLQSKEIINMHRTYLRSALYTASCHIGRNGLLSDKNVFLF